MVNKVEVNAPIQALSVVENKTVHLMEAIDELDNRLNVLQKRLLPILCNETYPETVEEPKKAVGSSQLSNYLDGIIMTVEKMIKKISCLTESLEI